MDAERARETIAAQAPRRLRFEELLRELGAREEHSGEARTDHLTVGDLLDRAAEGSFAFMIALLSLIAIPFLGLSTPFGIAIALLGAQMMFGRIKPWLPKRVRNRPLSMTMLDKVARMLARRTRWLVKATRRRWEPVIRTRLIGLAIFVLALGLALPLPIPGSNWVFLIPLFVYAIGLLERDGLWIVLGHIAFVIDMALLFAFGNAVLMVLAGIWRWLT